MKYYSQYASGRVCACVSVDFIVLLPSLSGTVQYPDRTADSSDRVLFPWSHRFSSYPKRV